MPESSKGSPLHQSFGTVKRWWTSCSASSPSISIFVVLLFVSATLIVNLNDLSKFTNIAFLKKQQAPPSLNGINGSLTSSSSSSSPSSCPGYFGWIHEDLKPWKSTGITRDMVERGKNISDFRLVILKGRAYVEQYRKSYQTRDVFTLWGISQLLKMYPGKVPDLELLFLCGDRPMVQKTQFLGTQSNASSLAPPPLFHYCGDDSSFDIVFPDWTYWGWMEVNIRPWETILKKIQEGNMKIKWKDRIPYAFWKGNSHTSFVRRQLLKCNVSKKRDWNARTYALHWRKEVGQKFKNTQLEDQCTHRYKIYAEGITWSVSEKYILACDSMTMFIEPKYYDFYTRSLAPLQHYWPISAKNMCRNIKFAVDWGNSHTDEAQRIGKEGTKYLEENLKMKMVYDYMFHLLKEYASLLKFKPIVPAGATELCSEAENCHMEGLGKEFMAESMVKSPTSEPPCAMPPPYDPQELRQFLQTKKDLVKQVETGKVKFLAQDYARQ